MLRFKSKYIAESFPVLVPRTAETLILSRQTLVMWSFSSLVLYKIDWDKSMVQSLRWRHNEHHGVSNHQPHGCLLNRLFRHRSKKTSKLRVTGLCEGNSLATGEFPTQRASNAENVSIWWRHHVPTYMFITELIHAINVGSAKPFLQLDHWLLLTFYLSTWM